ncbi:MAG TPA: hypothetical protein VGZ47_06065 [Gemmataceae bacterium]|jgi:hypothetical protein|nr:hypothetical protein [Gemmataceae bacterium]
MCRLLFPAVLLVLAFLAPTLSEAQEPLKTIELKITNNNTITVMIELYQDGKLIRTREIPGAIVAASTATFSKLKAAKYEVHFLATGYKPFVKRVLLSEDDMEQTVSVELAVNGGVTGGGVSLQELAEQIAQLKKENVEIRKEIENLRFPPKPPPAKK